MRVLVFRHIAIEHLGWIEPALTSAGIEPLLIDLHVDPAASVPYQDVAGFIFLGGPMSVNDEPDYLRRELGILDMALAAGKPLLGICLGAQLIARALGARVYPNGIREIGWGSVERTDAGRIDPLFAQFHDPETVLHWHGETFDLPAGATWLAFSRDCANQAFRYGASVYGLQFHLEATPEMISDWCAADVNAADLARLPEPVDPLAHAGRMQELSRATFSAWTGLLFGARAGRAG